MAVIVMSRYCHWCYCCVNYQDGDHDVDDKYDHPHNCENLHITQSHLFLVLPSVPPLQQCPSVAPVLYSRWPSHFATSTPQNI